MKKMKKIFIFAISLSILLSGTAMQTFKLFAETSVSNQSETQSMHRLMDLEIFSKTTPDKMDLNRTITREEMAVILVRVNGQEDKRSLYQNSSLYSDVPKTRWSNTYIQVSIKMGYMSPMPDGKFHPTEKVSFTQAATILGRLLKYDETNLTGSYPQNYLTQLSNLEILEGITYSPSGPITRGQLVVMLDKLFDTKVYNSEVTFVETLSNYQSTVILDNNVLSPNEDERRLVTDKGTFYLKDGLNIPEAGKKYLFRMKDKEIQYSALANLEFKELSVSSISTGKITTNGGEKISVPAGIPFYYNGQETDYESVSSFIQANSSIIIGYNGNDAVYGALFDPLYSQPEVITAARAGVPLEIQFSGLLIEKGGKYVTASQVEVNDVVYKVTDIWKKNGYVIVYANTVSGKISAILPSKISPVSLEIDSKSYTLDDSFPKGKLTSSGTNQVGETARIILGADGTVVDMISDSIAGTNSYAFVLNAYTQNSINTADFGIPYYYVTLLHSDGGKNTYLVNNSKSSLRGDLVTYEVTATGTDYHTATLKSIDTNISGSYKVNKEERMLGDSYVANGAVLFNIKNTATAEIDASVISFGDLPAGILMNGQVKYLHKSGDFMDIDVMLLDNALDENVAYGLVTGKKTTMSNGGSPNETGIIESVENITLLINGQSMTYTKKESGLYYNSVAKVKLNGGSISSIAYTISADAYADEIEAVDSSRIRMNGKVYAFHKNLSIYKLKGDSTWKKLETFDLTKGTDYGSVTVYLDKPSSYGGKVVMISLR